MRGRVGNDYDLDYLATKASASDMNVFPLIYYEQCDGYLLAWHVTLDSLEFHKT